MPRTRVYKHWILYPFGEFVQFSYASTQTFRKFFAMSGKCRKI